MNPKQTFLRALSLSTAVAALLGVAPKGASATRTEAANTEQAISELGGTHSRRRFVLTPAPPENTDTNLHLAAHGSHSSHSSHSSHASGSTGGGDDSPTPTYTPPPVTPPPSDVSPVVPPEAVAPTPVAPPPEPSATVPPAPGVPSGLSAAPDDGTVRLRWDAVDGALSYNVKRATSPQGPYLLIGSRSGTVFTDLRLQNGLTYYYVVSSLNASGESDNSDHRGATPNGPLPPPPASPAPRAAPAAPRHSTPKPSSSPTASPVGLLSAANLVGVSDSALVIMRNTPYARHGYSFPGVKPKTISLRQYFRSKPWYRPDTDDEAVAYSRLSANERANIDLIVRVEKERHPEKQ